MIRSYDAIVEPILVLDQLFKVNHYDDILKEIFTNLDFTEILSTISLIDKNCNKISTDPFFLKRVIYKNAFNPDDWCDHFGNDSFGANDGPFAFEKLPNTIVDLYKSNCKIFAGEKVCDTHLLFWVPENLSIEKYGKFLKHKFNKLDQGYQFLYPKIPDEYGKVLTKQGSWVLMVNKPIPESGGKTFSQQCEMVNELNREIIDRYSIPTALEAIICISVKFFLSQEKIFYEFYTRCQESLNSMVFGNKQVIVGFSKLGICVTFDYYRFNNIVMAPTLNLL